LLIATLATNRTITITAPSVTTTTHRVAVQLIQSGTNGVVTWDGAIAAPGAIAPTLGATDGNADIFNWFWNGSRWVFSGGLYSVGDL
jgi:hypothetical protein